LIPALGPLVVGVLFRFRFLVFDGLWFVNFVWVGRANGFHGELLGSFEAEYIYYSIIYYNINRSIIRSNL